MVKVKLRALLIRALFVRAVIVLLLVLPASACLTLPEVFPCAQDGSCTYGLECVDKMCRPQIACRPSCPEGATCSQGICSCREEEKALCPEVCADLSKDVENCGTCGNHCGVGEVCSSGACVCPPEHRCGSRCVDIERDSGNCGACGNVCPAGRSCKPDATAGRAACRGPQACDVVEQDCVPGKCTVYDADGVRENRCVADDGSKVLDRSCMRERLGDDDCAKGLVCTSLGTGDTSALFCRQLCTVDKDCADIANNVCVALAPTTEKLRGGVCRPMCSPFESSCPSGAVCIIDADPDGTRFRTSCSGFNFASSDAGKRAEGQACQNKDQCARGLACFGKSGATGVCRRWCDNKHPCPSAMSCNELGGNSPPVGVCIAGAQ